MFFEQKYLNSTIIHYRAGTKNDPYIDITETKEIINGMIRLSEIPDPLSKVKILGMYEVPTANKKTLSINEYRVDYLEGLLSFHSILNGEMRTMSFKGRGNHYLSAARIWTKEQNGNVIETLEGIVEAGQEAIKNIAEVEQAVEDAESAALSANQAATNANNKAQLADTSAVNAKNQTDAAKLATDAANAAKTRADTAAQLATDKAGLAQAATDSANQVITKANTATTNANTAAALANEKASLADSTASSLVHKGTYDNNVTYIKRNLVYYQGATYMSTQDSKGQIPTNPIFWAKITNMIWKGTYSPSVTYQFGDVVKTSDNYNTYIAIKDGLTGVALTDTTSWTVLTTIKDLVTEAESLIASLNQILIDVQQAIESANNATQNATTQAGYAKTQGDYAKSQGNYAYTTATSMVNRGTYNATTSYVPLNIVSFNGKVYQNIKASTGITPTETANWFLLLTIATSVTWENISGKPANLETTEGAQVKADVAQANAIGYTNEKLGTLILEFPVIPAEYEVVADDTTDNTAGLQAYINDAIANNKTEIWIPAAEKPYLISDTLLISGSLNIIGEGEKSWIHSKINNKAPFKFLNANNSSIRDLKVSSLADVRTSSQQGAVTIQNSENVLLNNVSVTASAATGFFITDSRRVRVTSCKVNNTLADGIHTTSKSRDIIIDGNTIYDAGDDSISVVSYQSQAERVKNVIITNNIVVNGKARGITNIGGQSVKISDNIVEGTASCSILVHRDANPAYNTFFPIDTTISNNTLKNAGSVTPNVGNQNGIEVGESEDTKIMGNTVDGSKHRGIVVLSDAIRVRLDDNDSNNNLITGYSLQGSGIQAGINRAYNNGEQGFLIINLSNSSFEGIHVYDSSAIATLKHNIHIENSNNLSIGDMISMDNRGVQRIERALFIKGSSYIKHGKLILNKGTRPTYDTGNSFIEAYPFSVTAIPTAVSMGMFVVGQKLLYAPDNKTYVWNGAIWIVDDNLYVGAVAPASPPNNMIWIDIS